MGILIPNIECQNCLRKELDILISSSSNGNLKRSYCHIYERKKRMILEKALGVTHPKFSLKLCSATCVSEIRKIRRINKKPSQEIIIKRSILAKAARDYFLKAEKLAAEAGIIYGIESPEYKKASSLETHYKMVFKQRDRRLREAKRKLNLKTILTP